MAQPVNQMQRGRSEEEVLERAINVIDPILAKSLKREQKQRRSRKLLIGGLVMTTLAIAVVMGSLLSQPYPDAGNAANSGVVGANANPTSAPTDPLAAIEQAETLSQQGWSIWKKGDWRAAEMKFSQAVELDKKSPSAWNGLGWSRLNGGRYNLAIEAFDHCIKLGPKHPGALNGMGQSHLMLREYKKAEIYLTKAAPNAPAAWWGLTRVYLLQEKFDQAKPWAKKLVDEQPNASHAKQMLQAAEAGKLDDELRRLIEPPAPLGADQAAAQALSARGWRYFNQGKHRAAEAAFRQVLEKDPDHTPALNGLGFALLNNGRIKDAKPFFDRCLEQEPEHVGAMNGLARCFKESGEIDQALAVWEKMDQLVSKSNPQMRVHAGTHGLAFTHMDRKDYAKALPYLEALHEAQSDDPRIKAALETAKRELGEN